LRITITGATGLIGSSVVAACKARGDDVTVLSRAPGPAGERLGVEAVAWDPLSEAAPAHALSGRDAVVHLAGENVAQRWTARARSAIRESRVKGTRNLVAGLREAQPRPLTLVSGSAVGYYGPRGREPIDEEASPGHDFLADVCIAWEREASAAAELGLRVVRVRTGVVLDRGAGALAKMLPAFRAGIGGPVAGGQQYIPWIHRDDVVGMILAALDNETWTGPINASAPEPVTNAVFSAALGHALHRPSLLPVPGLALRLLYGEMAEIVTGGVRAVPARPLVFGYSFLHAELDEALSSVLA
jgi:uncharacterized protein (TIGR01777 family)